MTKYLQAIRGMNDVLPEQVVYWQHLEYCLRKIAGSCGYCEIRFPIVEQTALFKRTIGEVTDIVEKEMYTFEDRNGDSLSLRPEGTAGCVRASIEHGLLHNQIQRFWYMGPMFRHERPQKGRYRQFYQFGVEAFGMSGAEIDAEMIFMTARLWQLLGVDSQLVLQLNSLGTLAERHRYRQALVDYFQGHFDRLDEDSKRRLTINPLRILDSKVPTMQLLIHHAPILLDYLGQESLAHFERLKYLLDAAKIPYKVNPYIVRGLDYYGSTVFEWVTHELGAKGTVCAGGRFDALVEQLGGKPMPAVGFALGLERVVELLEKNLQLHQNVHCYFIAVGDAASGKALLLAEDLRQAIPDMWLQVNCGGGSFKTQFKRADKSGAKMALIMGEDELAKDIVGVKFLREEKPQETIAIENLKTFLSNEL